MLDVAQKYSDILRLKFTDTTYDEKYKFYHGDYVNEYKPSENTWNGHEFVSVSSDGEVLGYVKYSIDRSVYYAYGFVAINFSDDKVTFGRDLIEAVENIFLKFNFNKLNFGVYVGNPIEHSYDRMIEKYGGRIVGVKKENVMLSDGNIYDYKMYEIMKSDFKNTKNGEINGD